MFAHLSMNKFRIFKNKNMLKAKDKPAANKSRVNLTELEVGKSAKVRELCGNPVLTRRLKAMGILPNAIIIKKSAISSEGPIVVEKGSIQFAVGYDMAENIIVDPIQKKNI